MCFAPSGRHVERRFVRVSLAMSGNNLVQHYDVMLAPAPNDIMLAPSVMHVQPGPALPASACWFSLRPIGTVF